MAQRNLVLVALTLTKISIMKVLKMTDNFINVTSLRKENVDLPGCNTFSVMPADLKSTPSNPAKKKEFFSVTFHTEQSL